MDCQRMDYWAGCYLELVEMSTKWFRGFKRLRKLIIYQLPLLFSRLVNTCSYAGG